MFIRIEDTPNPNTLKFLPGFNILDEGITVYFLNIEQVQHSKLAYKLFKIKYVARVLFNHDFIAITKEDNNDWDIIKVDILTTIVDHFTAGGTVLDSKTINVYQELDEKFFDKQDIEIVNKIQDLMDNYIKPSVTQDGGDIKFRGYKSGIVYVELQGACSGCPQSSITLKQGIQNMLQYHIPEIVGIESIA
ncbi:NifU family protein [Wolbachia endosymbiont of Howardula sp.]|uniref:NifU family protein n=1 Tax=Wolbachia endosymbiont of Howardula sp. TaxID=2916816 RepID=UPI00217D5C03|nr:NifU family protein [Wolbachia endosymbiont of Howardula sp.]UWI83023.1 NifU family protein [Wolbachia endosymbiont of Howardula sp.]